MTGLVCCIGIVHGWISFHNVSFSPLRGSRPICPSIVTSKDRKHLNQVSQEYPILIILPEEILICNIFVFCSVILWGQTPGLCDLQEKKIFKRTAVDPFDLLTKSMSKMIPWWNLFSVFLFSFILFSGINHLLTFCSFYYSSDQVCEASQSQERGVRW